jgi:hypothetical protein
MSKKASEPLAKVLQGKFIVLKSSCFIYAQDGINQLKIDRPFQEELSYGPFDTPQEANTWAAAAMKKLKTNPNMNIRFMVLELKEVADANATA